MAYQIRLWRAGVVAGMVALLLGVFAQNPAAVNSAPLSPSAPTSTADDLRNQIKDLLKRCDEDINVHGDFERAAEDAQRARDLSRKAGDKVNETSALVYLGAALGYQGRLNEAYDVAQQTLVTARESGDKKVLEQALNNMGSIAGELGRYEESVASFYACLDVARKINDPVMEYMSLLNVGEAYTRSGEPVRADDPLQKALKLAETLDHGDPQSKARSKKGKEMVLLNLAGMEVALGHHAAALRYFEQVRASQPETPLWAIAALEGMANASQLMGKSEDAIPLYEQALAQAEKSSGGLQIARIRSSLGVSQEATGQFNAALASENESLKTVHAAGGDPDLEWKIESHIGHVLRAMGRNEEALEHYQQSIAGIERLRPVALKTEEGRAGVLVNSHDTFTETADLLVDLHRNADAFAIAEQGRARGFLDMLALMRGGLQDELTPEQQKTEESLHAQISSAQQALWKEGLNAKEEQQHKAEIKSAEESLEALRVEVRHSNPRYASIRFPEPVNLSRIQSDLLDDKTVLLEFLLGPKRSLVLIVSRNSVTVESLPPRREIENEVTEYRRLLTEKASVLTLHSSLGRIDHEGSVLYKSLLAPVRRVIPTGDTLIIVPDGSLNYIPFETLVAGSSRDAAGEVWPVYALQNYGFVFAPSASALLAVRTMNTQKGQWDKTLLAFGDPFVQPMGRAGSGGNAVRSVDAEADANGQPALTPKAYDVYTERGFSMDRLPFSREEVLGIGALFPAAQRQLYFGALATEDTMKRENLSEYRYIHFATHGFLDETAPGRSGILLSPDPSSRDIGLLQAGDIMRLKLNADLVTLSACSTGLGEMVNGEGILGLTRAFFYAGARNLTVSLWNVNDSATSELMKRYYANLIRGDSKSEALRRAKLQLLRGSNPAWRSPYFWGAFVLVGNGK